MPQCIAHCSSKSQIIDAWSLIESYQSYLEKLNIYNGNVLAKFFKILEGQLEENPDRVMELVAAEASKTKKK